MAKQNSSLLCTDNNTTSVLSQRSKGCVFDGLDKWLDARKNPEEIATKYMWTRCMLCMHHPGTKDFVQDCVRCCSQCKIWADYNGNKNDNRAVFTYEQLAKRYPVLKIYKLMTGDLCFSSICKDVLEKKKIAFVTELVSKGPDTFFSIMIRGVRYFILLEEDGDKGHANYSGNYAVDIEFDRMDAIFAVLRAYDPNCHILLIRYVPLDPYRLVVGSKKKEHLDTFYNPGKALRMIIVRSWLLWYANRAIYRPEATMPPVVLLYLFYDKINRHMAEAKRQYSGSEDVWVGWTGTIPQDEIRADGKIDWRYASNVNEGLLFELASRKADVTGVFKNTVSEVLVGL